MGLSSHDRQVDPGMGEEHMLLLGEEGLRAGGLNLKLGYALLQSSKV